MRKQPRTSEKRRNRPIGFTDTEWSTIGRAAADMNVGKARYVVEQVFNKHEERFVSDRQLQIIMAHKAIAKTFDQLCALLPQSGSLMDAFAVADELIIMNRHLQLIVNLSLGYSENNDEDTP